MLAAVAASVAWIVVREPEYAATSQILVSPLPPDDPALEGVDVLRADPSDSTRTVQTAASLVDSPAAAALAARRLGSGWTPSEVSSAVEVEPQGDSNVLAVTATADDPDEAARVANVFAEASLDARAVALRRQAGVALSNLRTDTRTGDAAVELAQREDRLRAVQKSGDPAFSLSQPATPPTSPEQTGAVILIALSLIAGFTIGATAALVAELLDSRVRDEDELRQLYPLPVLAHVPELRGRERRSLRSPQTTPPMVREAFRTLQVQFDRIGQLPRVLMFTSASTGDAKTTSAVQFAITLVMAGHRVIVVDFDLRKPDVARALGITPKKRFASAFSDGVDLDDLLVEYPQAPGLRILPTDPGNVLLLDAITRRLPELFHEARGLADYVIVDTPPLGEISDALRLVDLVDDIVLVARPGHTNRDSLEMARDLMTRSGHDPTGMLIVGGAAIKSSYYALYAPAAQPGLGSRRVAKND